MCKLGPEAAWDQPLEGRKASGGEELVLLQDPKDQCSWSIVRGGVAEVAGWRPEHAGP